MSREVNRRVVLNGFFYFRRTCVRTSQFGAGWHVLIEKKKKKREEFVFILEKKKRKKSDIDENCMAVNLDYHFPLRKLVPSRYLTTI